MDCFEKNSNISEKDKDEFMMTLEANRLSSFVNWPFLESCSCTPQKMAEAGFYHCPSDCEPDLVRCYVCQKELDGWDPTDDPWKEHASHSKACPFVVLNKKQSDMTLVEYLKLEAERQTIRVQTVGDASLKILKSMKDQVKNDLNVNH